MSDPVLYEKSGAVVTLTLNRHETRNAISEDEMVNAMVEHCAAINADKEVRVAILTGAGSAFCSGGDVKGMGQRNASASEQPPLEKQFTEMVARHREIAGALHAMRKPTITALPGAAAGAGMAIALSCDMRVASGNGHTRISGTDSR